MTIYRKYLADPWFTLVSLGLKKINSELNFGDFSQMKEGDIIIFINSGLGFERECKVSDTSNKYL